MFAITASNVEVVVVIVVVVVTRGGLSVEISWNIAAAAQKKMRNEISASSASSEKYRILLDNFEPCLILLDPW